MVSEKVITETVWTETNRNLALSPFGTAALPGYGAGSTATISGEYDVTPYGVPVPTHPPTGQRVRFPVGAAVGGGVELTGPLAPGNYTASMYVMRRAGATTALGLALKGIRSLESSRTFTFGAWTYVAATFTIAPEESGAIVGWRNQVLDPVASEFLIVDIQVAPTDKAVPQGSLVISGATAGEDELTRYRWLGQPEASISVRETGEVVTGQLSLFEVVTLTTSRDEIVFHAEPNPTGFVYDNDTLQRWYNPAPIVADVDKRPNAHGAYGLGQTFTAEHKPLISGQYYGLNSADAKRARARLVATFSEGHPVTIAVTDEEGVTTRREAWLVDYDAPFAADFSHFTFDLEYIAPDPRRYGATESSSTGLPTPGSGLVWNLGTAPSGLYFDWGTIGSLGQISVTNNGGAATNPRIEVGEGGAFLAGFRITEIETGRELILERPTDLGDVVVLDSRTQRATLNGGDISRFLVSRDWFEIPAGATRRYQINPLGATSGAPTMTIYTASASL